MEGNFLSSAVNFKPLFRNSHHLHKFFVVVVVWHLRNNFEKTGFCFNLKTPDFFSRWLWTNFLWNLLCLKIFVSLFCSSSLWNFFCKSNIAAPKKWRAVAVIEIHKKLTCGSPFCSVESCKTQIYLKRLRRTSSKSQLFKLTKENLLKWFFH